MSYQNITRTLTAQEVAAVKDHIAGIRTTLDFLIVLTPEERRAFFKLGDARLAYVQKTQSAAHAFPQAVPSGFDLSDYDDDATLFAQLSEINTLLQSLSSEVNDTRLAVGSEAVKASSTIYGYLKAGVKTILGLKTVVADIADLFKRQPKTPAAPKS